MKGKLFLRVGLLLFAAILLGSAVTYAIAQPQLAGTEARAQVSSHLLWLLPIALCLAAAGGWAVARGIVDPIRKIDPETPGTEAPYEELVPLLARIRAQNRLIRQQEETLGQTRRDFAAITENMGESFLLLDKRLNVLSRNVSASYLLPAPPDGEADNLNRGGCPEEIVRAAERALAGRRTELTLEMHERYYYVIATPVFSENQITGSVVIALDTTEREQREALRREFSANVSHELKTPLTSISGFAELLANGMVPPERVGEFAGDIYKESQRLMALVDDIIELSRLEEETAAPETESVDLYALAEETLASLCPVAERRDVTLTLRGGEAVVQGVRTALQELVYNLCDNAVKYNRPGGSVTVAAAKRFCLWRIRASAFRMSTRTGCSSGFTAWTRAIPGSSAARVSAFPSSSTPRRCTRRALSSGASRTPEPRSPSTLTDNKAFENPRHGHWMSVPGIFCVLCKVNKLKRFPLYKTGI